MKRRLRFLTLVITIFFAMGSTIPAYAATAANTYAPTKTEAKTNSTEAPLGGGEEVHGDWWGPTTYFDSVSDGLLVSAIEFFITEFAVPANVAKYIGYAIFGTNMLAPGTPYWGYEYKHYEEIYVNGEFAYFRTTVYVYAYYDPYYEHEIGHAEWVFESTQPMSIEE